MTLHSIAEQLNRGKLDLNRALVQLSQEEDLLRWFVADCVQHVVEREAREQRLPPPEVEEALTEARRVVLGEALEEDLRALLERAKEASFEDLNVDEDGVAVREMAWLSARAAACALLSTSLVMAAQVVSDEAATEAYWAAAYSAPRHQRKQRKAHAKRLEFSWQCARLAYLCEVWATCGHRAASLLFEKRCPLPAPQDAHL